MSAHASQAFSIEHCTDSEDLPQTPLEGSYHPYIAFILRGCCFTEIGGALRTEGRGNEREERSLVWPLPLKFD